VILSISFVHSNPTSSNTNTNTNSQQKEDVIITDVTNKEGRFDYCRLPKFLRKEDTTTTNENAEAEEDAKRNCILIPSQDTHLSQSGPLAISTSGYYDLGFNASYAALSSVDLGGVQNKGDKVYCQISKRKQRTTEDSTWTLSALIAPFEATDSNIECESIGFSPEYDNFQNQITIFRRSVSEVKSWRGYRNFERIYDIAPKKNYFCALSAFELQRIASKQRGKAECRVSMNLNYWLAIAAKEGVEDGVGCSANCFEWTGEGELVTAFFSSRDGIGNLGHVTEWDYCALAGINIGEIDEGVSCDVSLNGDGNWMLQAYTSNKYVPVTCFAVCVAVEVRVT